MIAKNTHTVPSHLLLIAVALLLLSSCGHHPSVPSEATACSELPAIFPDYCNVTVPCNIAPLNFMLPADEYEACVARFTVGGDLQSVGGDLQSPTVQTYGNGVKVQIPESEWHAMLDAAKGKSIKVEVWGLLKRGEERGERSDEGQWLSFSPFEIHVAEEPIDEYLSYRLIEPSYVAWTYMEIAQRNLTSFEETQIFNNEITMNNNRIGQCINCHSYQNYKTDNMLFHVRLANAGTVIVNDGKVSRVNLKRDYTISGGVYPSWHPTEKLIAFSTNRTRQGFHTLNPNKIEVYDEASDLILYDVETDSVSVVSEDPDLLEVYPTWSPDGKYLYYCKSVPLPEEMRDKDIRTTYPKIQYNLYRRAFDLSTHGFGDEELVYDAAAQDKSATLPRISPDGRYLLFALGHYGCFHSRHREADIVCIPIVGNASQRSVVGEASKLCEVGNASQRSVVGEASKLCEVGNASKRSEVGETQSLEASPTIDLTPLNSEGYSDSYPSWSSNGHWIMVASRRLDDNYSRVFFSYFNNGKVEKAFLLPQEDPEYNTFLLKSYNRPEFMVEPVKISVEEFSRVFG